MKFFSPAGILLFIVLIGFSACGHGGRGYTKCQEGCRYRYMSCMDRCPGNSINFSFDFSTGFFSCPDRCEEMNRSCLRGCVEIDRVPE